MKQFFKFMFASMLGFFLTGAIVVLLFIGIIGAMVASSSDTKETSIKENTVLHIQLKNRIQDRPSDNPFESFDFANFETKTPLGLKNIIDNINKAKNDDRIKGIYLDIPYLQASLANIEEIRNTLINFKSSGKFIVSYSESYSQNEYYLASVADEIYLNPAGGMTFKGLSAQVMFFKEALSRLEVEMQVIRHGKFKSAIEPFIMDSMSAANRKQMSVLVNSVWDNQISNISEARSISIDQINEIADGLLVRTASDAESLKLVDGLLFEDEVLDLLKDKVGLEKSEELETITLKKLRKAKKVKGENEDGNREKAISKNKIAIVFAEGEIISGKSSDGMMGSQTIAKAIKDAREDDKVKSIVLRINSPGGSALASDVIWREVVLAKAKKPVVVSMGSVAASGGYYIACAADEIFAEDYTITGSIGVFGLIPNMEGMFNNKLGINIDRVNTNTFSDGLTLFRPLKQTEREAIKEQIEEIYDDFTQKVAEGRGMTQAEVDSIGQGRVWTGSSAIEIGLVDKIGGLSDAIAAAADLAELEDYKLKELPVREDPFEKIMKEFSEDVKMRILGEEFGEAEKYYMNIKSVLSSRGIYSRMPVDIIIE